MWKLSPYFPPPNPHLPRLPSSQLPLKLANNGLKLILLVELKTDCFTKINLKLLKINTKTK
jgi:hypothetical protein